MRGGKMTTTGGGGNAICLGGFETKKRAITTSARAVRMEAEINRRKSLLPSALSGPFRPVKIIYRKDWCARLLFPSDEFRDGPLGDAEIFKRKRKKRECIRRERNFFSPSLPPFPPLSLSICFKPRAHSAKLLEEIT